MIKLRNYSSFLGAGHRHLRAASLILAMAVCLTLPGSAYAKKRSQTDPVTNDISAASARENSDEFTHYSLTLEELGALKPIELRSVNGERSLPFSIRKDVVISDAKLKLTYAWSPSLIPELSHLKIRLNDELMTSLPLNHENSNGYTSEVRLDPSMFVDFNQLNLGLVAHYTKHECEDPMHSSLWANISNQSKLELTVRHLRLPNDLALLPAPFFDSLDSRKLTLPIVFPAQPNNGVLRAAGVVASWFGSLASYRGAQFPTLINVLPKGNGIVMVTGSTAPANLGLPEISGPSIAVVDNPLNANAKLLVLMGRDTNELDVATQALTLGTATLTGGYVSVKQLNNIPARKPYDAPNWIPTDRAVHFGELVKRPDLQVEGLNPDMIRVNFSVPPDIFAWRSPGVPVDLRYRYNQRPKPDRSNLNISMNGEYVRSLPLTAKPDNLDKAAGLLALGAQDVFDKAEVLIPHGNFYERNQLQFRYFFDYSKEGLCKDVFLNNERGMIDPDSSIDFSSFPHYTALPNLAFFAHDGFPYTRMADLSETAVVMPDNASPMEMETYFMLMGHIGKVTGYPAIRHAVISAANVEANADKDMIVIGTAGNQALLARWSDNVHPLLEKGSHTLRMPGFFERLLWRWESRDLADAMHRVGDLVAQGSSGLGALVAFESPLKSGRSVVVFTGDTPDQIATLGASMTDPKLIANFHGDLVLQSGKRIESFQTGPSYFVGSLPLVTAIAWYLSSHPLVLFVLIGLAALLASVMAFRYLRRRAGQRLEG